MYSTFPGQCSADNKPHYSVYNFSFLRGKKKGNFQYLEMGAMFQTVSLTEFTQSSLEL